MAANENVVGLHRFVSVVGRLCRAVADYARCFEMRREMPGEMKQAELSAPTRYSISLSACFLPLTVTLRECNYRAAMIALNLEQFPRIMLRDAA